MTPDTAGNPEFFDVFFDLAESGFADVRRGFGGWVPEVYDLMEGDFEDDIPHILSLAAQAGGPILDLGSGTGRLTIPLLRAGHEVIALDSDPRMQEMLSLKASALGGGAEKRLTQIQADLRSFRIPAPARLAVCSTNTFLYLGSLGAQREALAAVRENLAEGGRLWLDVFVPKPNPSATEPYLTSLADPETGRLLRYGAQSRDDHFTGQSHVNAFTIVFHQGRQPDIFVQEWTYSWLHPNELRLLLESEGFELLELLGDYEGDEADDTSIQMIAIARKTR